jgi:uncharacterized protein YbjT (DUF2867 family)
MTTATYSNVLLVGAAGSLGKYIFAALLTDPTFNVTVLSRINSNSTLPSSVKVLKVDYSNKDALVEALVGQDVVISTVGSEGLTSNFDSTLVEAALQAGVKWFIPSQFVSDVSHPFYSPLPFVASKVATMELLKKNQSRIAYTFITTGTFLDWGFDSGFLGFDISNHTATLYDEGKHLFSGTTLPSIGKALVAVLHHPELTQNKHIYIADATFTQQQALSLFEKHTGSKWTVKHINTEDSFKQGADDFTKGDVRKDIDEYLMTVIYLGHTKSSGTDPVIFYKML